MGALVELATQNRFIQRRQEHKLIPLDAQTGKNGHAGVMNKTNYSTLDLHGHVP